MLIATVVNLFRKTPIAPEVFNPFARRTRQQKAKPLNPKLSLDLLGAAVIK